jgi:hypothetical protein
MEAAIKYGKIEAGRPRFIIDYLIKHLALISSISRSSIGRNNRDFLNNRIPTRFIETYPGADFSGPSGSKSSSRLRSVAEIRAIGNRLLTGSRRSETAC